MTTALVENASATGSAIEIRGGQYLLTVVASAYGTVKLQRRAPDGTTWIDVPDASFTANGLVRAFLPYGYVRANISGASGVYVWLEPFGIGVVT